MSGTSSPARLARLLLAVWLILNLFNLVSYPFVHSDEIWLAGITSQMIRAGSPGVTEPFFDLLPRQPHGMRILFHLFQAPFLAVFRDTVTAVRLFSLFTAAGGLVLFFRLLKRLGIPERLSLIFTTLLGTDGQFVYAAHFGRQEIQILFCMLLGLNLFFGSRLSAGRRGLAVGLATGLAAGFHPNAFIAAWPAGLLYLGAWLTRRRSLREALIFLFSAAAGALVFFLPGFLMGPFYLRDYGEFGRSVGVRFSWQEKILAWPGFYEKLFRRISGTYYVPEMRIQLGAAAVLAAGLLAEAVIRYFPGLRSAGRAGIPGVGGSSPAGGLQDPAGKGGPASGDLPAAAGLAGILGINLGLAALGKYSQPSVLFLFPFVYILAARASLGVYRHLGPRLRRILPVLLVPLLLVSPAGILRDTFREKESFRETSGKIRALIPENSRVLGNLLWSGAWEKAELLDLRNLPLLEEAGLDFREYVRSRRVEYIIAGEELRYINRSRPVWNLLYGNPYPWEGEMEVFLEEECVLAGEVESPGYGIRIPALRYTAPWPVRIYRVRSDSISR